MPIDSPRENGNVGAGRSPVHQEFSDEDGEGCSQRRFRLVSGVVRTPMENHLGELWSLMRTISPGLLGSWERFRKQFAEPIEKGADKDRLKALSRVVRPFILRRTKKEVLTELPPRTEIVRLAEFSDAERKKYDAARLARSLSFRPMTTTRMNNRSEFESLRG